MAKGKDFKKPVNNEELIINEEDEKNKRLIIIVCLSIVVVLGLIIASISYFNGRNVEDDKKNNKNEEKPNEIIEKPKPEEKPTETPKTDVVVNKPNYSKPNNPIVIVTPEEPEVDEPQVITNVSGNDYSVVMEGNTAKVSGVSRFITLEGSGDVKTVVQLRVLLDSKYTKADLETDNLNNLVITATTNGVTDNYTNYVVKEDTETGRLYFDYVQPVGKGEVKPKSFTIKYGDGYEETYNIDLSDLRIETEASTEEELLVVVPEKTDSVVGIDLPYDVQIFRQLTSDQIEWKDEPVTASLDDESIVNDTIQSNANEVLDQDSTTIEEPENFTYTVKFTKGEEYGKDYEINTDSIGSEVNGYKNVLVIKVYAPEKDGVTIDDTKVVITGTKPNGEKYEHNGEKEYINHDDKGTYVYLYYAADTDPEKQVQVDPKPVFTIDWDGEGKDYGTYTYEFDITELMKPEETDTPSEGDSEPTPEPTEVEGGEAEQVSLDGDIPEDLGESNLSPVEILDQTSVNNVQEGMLD